MNEGPCCSAKTKALLLGITLATVTLCVCSYFLWDQPAARYFEQHTSWKPLGKVLTEAGDSVFWLPPALLGFLLLRYVWRAPLWSRRCGFLFACVALSGVLVNVIKEALGRARPKELLENGVFGFHPFQFHFDSHFQGFPSGHATTFLAVGVACGCCWPRGGWLALPLCIALSFTRVIVNAHYLSDVFAGMLLGAFSALLVRYWFERKAWALKPDAASGAGR